jgi:predicted GNAT family acetyltransferase
MSDFTKYNSRNPCNEPLDSEIVREFCRDLKRAALTEGALIKFKAREGTVPSQRLVSIVMYADDWVNYRNQKRVSGQNKYFFVENKIIFKVLERENTGNGPLRNDIVIEFLKKIGLQDEEIFNIKAICHEKSFGVLSLQNDSAMQVFAKNKYRVLPIPQDLNEAARNKQLSGKVPGVINGIEQARATIQENGRTPAMTSDWKGRFDLLGGHLTYGEAMNMPRGIQLGLIRQTFVELELEKVGFSITRSDNEEVHFAMKKVDDGAEIKVYSVVVTFLWDSDKLNIVSVDTTQVYSSPSVDVASALENLSLNEKAS